MIKTKILLISIILFVIATLLGLYAYFYGNFFSFDTAIFTSSTKDATQPVVRPLEGEKDTVFGSELKKNFYLVPSKLVFTFNSQTKTIPIVQVGLDEKGGLEAPKDWNVAGWYRKSSRAGQTGNVIIDGHYDNNVGAPAAFWELKNLKTDDKVELVDTLGRTFTYQITETYYVNIDDPDRLRIFESSADNSHLTLVTCGGVWLPGQFNYSQRLVVKGELKR